MLDLPMTMISAADLPAPKPYIEDIEGQLANLARHLPVGQVAAAWVDASSDLAKDFIADRGYFGIASDGWQTPFVDLARLHHGMRDWYFTMENHVFAMTSVINRILTRLDRQQDGSYDLKAIIVTCYAIVFVHGLESLEIGIIPAPDLSGHDTMSVPARLATDLPTLFGHGSRAAA